jgi:hypothetical protein
MGIDRCFGPRGVSMAARTTSLNEALSFAETGGYTAQEAGARPIP